MTKYAAVFYEKKELVSVGLVGIIKSVNKFALQHEQSIILK